MKGKLAILLALLTAVLLIASACTTTAEAQQTLQPEPTDIQTAEPVPEPTPVLPVTRQDIPAMWLPGLAEIGAVPTEAYTIGMVTVKTPYEAAWENEANAMAAAYEERFGVRILTTVTEDSAAAQAAAVSDMAAQGIDFLILSPCSNGATESVQICENAKIPYITMGARIDDAAPGQGSYVCAFRYDEYMTGVLTGLSVVDKMTKKYGAPRGNIGEITDAVDSEASQMRSMGIRRVLAAYDELNVVCSMIGGNTQDTQYKAAGNVLKAFREGELSGVIAMNDDIAMQTLQAALDTDRDELVGNIWTMEAGKNGLAGVWHGQFAMAVEHTAHSGMLAVEYALQYLEGGNIPPEAVCVTRVFTGDTQERKDDVAMLIAVMEQAGTDAIFDSMGSYAPFMPDTDALALVYPMPYFQQSDADTYLAEFEPFATGDAIYADMDGEE